MRRALAKSSLLEIVLSPIPAQNVGGKKTGGRDGIRTPGTEPSLDSRNFNDLRRTDLCWRENARLVRSITNATAAHIKCGGFWGARQLPGVSQTCSRVFRISASDPIRDIDQGSSVGLSAGDLLAESETLRRRMYTAETSAIDGLSN